MPEGHGVWDSRDTQDVTGICKCAVCCSSDVLETVIGVGELSDDLKCE